MGGVYHLAHDVVRLLSCAFDRPYCLTDIFFFYSRHKIIGAGSGRSHTVVVTKDAISFAFGWNKHGQLGSGSMKNGGFPLRFGLLMSCDITDNVEKHNPLQREWLQSRSTGTSRHLACRTLPGTMWDICSKCLIISLFYLGLHTFRTLNL